MAFNKTAVLSSEYDKKHGAANAVDGMKICPYGLRAGSAYSVQPWLMIDLGDTYDVQKIVIYARNDYHGMSFYNNNKLLKKKIAVLYLVLKKI